MKKLFQKRHNPVSSAFKNARPLSVRRQRVENGNFNDALMKDIFKNLEILKLNLQKELTR